MASTSFHIERKVEGREKDYLPFPNQFAEGAATRKASLLQNFPSMRGLSRATTRRKNPIAYTSLMLARENPYSNAAALSLRVTGKRRFVAAELLEVTEILEKTSSNDELTTSIRGWHKNFALAVAGSRPSSSSEQQTFEPDVESVLEEYLSLLHQLFKDSLTLAPLNKEDAVLGSDGRTYHKTSLEEFEIRLPEQYRGRSPLDLENPSSFTVGPHPILREVLEWLEKIEAPHPSGPIDATEQLFRDVQALRFNQRRHLENKRAGGLRLLAQFAAEDNEKDREHFAFLRGMIQQNQEGQARQFAGNKEEEEREREKLRQAIEVLEKRIERLEQREGGLRQHIGGLQEEVKQIKQDHVQLYVGLQETRKAIDDRNKKARQSVWKSVGIVFGCIAANFLLQQAIGYLGGLAAA